jgi:hypothetical protein
MRAGIVFKSSDVLAGTSKISNFAGTSRLFGSATATRGFGIDGKIDETNPAVVYNANL